MMEWLNSILTYSSIILLISVLISSISDRWDYRVKMFYIYLWFFLSGIPGNFDIYTYDFTKIIYLFLHFQLSFMVCMSEILWKRVYVIYIFSNQFHIFWNWSGKSLAKKTLIETKVMLFSAIINQFWMLLEQQL